ncbi:unnamed protein product, partial [Adineta steineri]
TAEEALDFRDPTDEPSMEPVIDEHRDAEQSTTQWKFLTWSMIENFQPPSWINENIDVNME